MSSQAAISTRSITLETIALKRIQSQFAEGRWIFNDQILHGQLVFDRAWKKLLQQKAADFATLEGDLTEYEFINTALADISNYVPDGYGLFSPCPGLCLFVWIEVEDSHKLSYTKLSDLAYLASIMSDSEHFEMHLILVDRYGDARVFDLWHWWYCELAIRLKTGDIQI